nr:MAG TPA: hypothetical protein [Caudoviricetes sp.]
MGIKKAPTFLLVLSLVISASYRQIKNASKQANIQLFL